eukprot:GGOE01046798.1.p1 GENE.GGOE01046798.1~~GGOE01046798.1.p1  ORF type:complete len:360 (-),score=19.14 GGOE01046798.1:114-1193(-)
MEPIQLAMPRCSRSKTSSSLSNPLTQPYLSVITATRNDHYGGRMPSAYRTQQQVHNIANLALCHNLSIEHIVVDWNPDLSRPPLSTTLECAAYHHVRLLTVSTTQHAYALNVSGCLNEKTREMMELHAKNVGIRRARGQFLLVLNNDDLLSSAFLQFLAKQQLCPNILYSAVRYDLPQSLEKLPPVQCGSLWERQARASGKPHGAEKLPAKLRAHCSRAVNPVRFHFLKLLDPKVVAAVKKTGIFSGGAGDFNLAHRSMFVAAKGIPELCTRGAMDLWFVNTLAGRSKGHVLFVTAVLFHQWHRRAAYNAKRISASEAFHAGMRKRPLKRQPHWGLEGVHVAEVRLTANCSPCLSPQST